MSKENRRPKGEGSIYPTTINGKDYFVAQVMHNGKPKKLYGKTKLDASKKKKEFEEKQKQGLALDKGKLKISDIAKEWLESKVNSVEPNTYATYKYSVNKHILPNIGHLLVQKITTKDIQTLINQLVKKGLSNRSVRYAGYVIKTIIEKQAVDADIIAKNPAKRVRLPRPEKKEPKIWTDEEFRRFTEVNKDNRLLTAVQLQEITGIRKGECLGLTIPCVNLEERTLTIKEQYTPDAATGKSSMKKLKNIYSRRVLPICDETVELLKNQINKISEIYNPKKYLFPTSNGTPISPRNYQRAFDKMIETANVPKVKIHSLRSKFITDMIKISPDLKSISEYAGHSDTRMATEIYSYTNIERKRDLINRLEATKTAARE